MYILLLSDFVGICIYLFIHSRETKLRYIHSLFIFPYKVTELSFILCCMSFVTCSSTHYYIQAYREKEHERKLKLYCKLLFCYYCIESYEIFFLKSEVGIFFT